MSDAIEASRCVREEGLARGYLPSYLLVPHTHCPPWITHRRKKPAGLRTWCSFSYLIAPCCTHQKPTSSSAMADAHRQPSSASPSAMTTTHRQTPSAPATHQQSSPTTSNAITRGLHTMANRITNSGKGKKTDIIIPYVHFSHFRQKLITFVFLELWVRLEWGKVP